MEKRLHLKEKTRSDETTENSRNSPHIQGFLEPLTSHNQPISGCIFDLDLEDYRIFHFIKKDKIIRYPTLLRKEKGIKIINWSRS